MDQKFLAKNLISLKLNYSNLDLYLGTHKDNIINRKVVFFMDLSCLYRFIYGKSMKIKNEMPEGWPESYLFDYNNELKIVPYWTHEILNIIAHYRHYFNTKYRSNNVFYLYTSREENQSEFFDDINKNLETIINYIPGVYITKSKDNLSNFLRNLAITLSIEKTTNLYINMCKDESINSMLYTILDNLNIIEYSHGEIVYESIENKYSEFEELFNSTFYKHDLKKMFHTIILCRKYDKMFSRKRKYIQATMIKSIIDDGVDLVESMGLEYRDKILEELDSCRNDGIKEKIFSQTVKNWNNKLFDKSIFHINDNKYPDYIPEIKINWLMNND